MQDRVALILQRHDLDTLRRGQAQQPVRRVQARVDDGTDNADADAAFVAECAVAGRWGRPSGQRSGLHRNGRS